MKKGPRPDLDQFLELGLRAAFPKGTPARKAQAPGTPSGSPEPRGEAPPPPADLPEVVGGHRVERELGRGGMGIVLAARDARLGRRIAIKILKPELLPDAAALDRFVAEARTCGRLEHPGIVPVHEIGTAEDGRPYFAMRLVDGQTLAELLAARPSAAAERDRFLQHFERVCETVAYAHAAGVVHRDLKPANIMVGRFGEVLVLDWGLALTAIETTVADDGAPRRGAGITGTPSYMAPEQARGRRAAPDARTDVFSLGAILCEILTGAPPYAAETPGENLLAAAKGWLEDAYERLRGSDADPVLVDLAHACLAPEPERRPESAALVAAAVGNYFASVAVRARELEIAAAELRAREREERRVRRRTRLASLALLVAGLAVAGGFLHAARLRREQVEENGRVVGEMLERAGLLLGEGRARPGLGSGAFADAEAVVSEARSIARSAPLPGGLLERVEEAFVRVNAERERRATEELFAKRLVEIQEQFDDDADRRARRTAYAAVFRERGFDATAAAPEPLVQWVRGATNREDIVAALDDWLILCDPGDPASPWARIFDFLSEVDPDPDRRHLRELSMRRERAALLELARSDAPHSWPAANLRMLARALACLGERGDAVRVLERAQTRFPEEVSVNHDLGVLVRSEAERIEDAVRLFSMAIALRPRSGHLRADLAQVLLSAKRNAEALRVAEECVRVVPDYAPGWHYGGVARSLLAHPEAALRDFDIALRLDPDLAMAIFARGEALWLLGRKDEALETFRRATEKAPHSAQAAALLGSSLLEVGRCDDALPVLRRAAELAPGDAVVHYQLGECLQQLGLDGEAILAYEAALRVSPEFPEAWCNLGNLQWRRGRFDEAVESLRRGNTLGRARPGWAFPSDQWLKSAEELKHAARELDALDHGGVLPDESARVARLARAASLRGRHAQACELWAVAFEGEPGLGARGAPTNRFLAACAAAAVAAARRAEGQAEEAARLEARALEWLREELDSCDPIAHRVALPQPQVARQLARWGTEAALEPLLSGTGGTTGLSADWAAFRAEWEARIRELRGS